MREQRKKQGTGLQRIIKVPRAKWNKSKMLVDSTSKALSLTFNRSLWHWEIPADWKSENVVPIFKKGSKGDKNNYRLVSLTSLVVKLLGNFIRDQVQKFLDENKLIYSIQHGFIKGKTYLTNLI